MRDTVSVEKAAAEGKF